MTNRVRYVRLRPWSRSRFHRVNTGVANQLYPIFVAGPYGNLQRDQIEVTKYMAVINKRFG